jgi:pantoate--beta-alanine ligase
MVRPDRAYFGEKDYQQLKVIERMAVDLDMGVEVVGCETVREADGLAISSRNAYLSDEERSRALSLSRALREAADMVAGGERDAGKLTALARSVIESAGAGACVVDYIEVVDAESLAPVERIESEARMCLAVRIGTCRLIDNMRLDPSGLRG